MTPRTTLSLSRALALLLAPALLTACSAQSKTQGSNQDTVATYHATYRGWTLSTNLPAEARVPAVVAAAEQTLRARGYTITTSDSTEEEGEVVAHPPRTNNLPRIVIASARGVSSTTVDMRVEPFGDQELCRSVLDGMLQRMGM